MRTKTVAFLLIVAGALVALVAPAAAKGPSEGTIEGEGLDAPIAIGDGEGTPGGDELIGDVGFFEVTFGQIPSRALASAPTEDLGPRLTLRWVVPGPDGRDDIIVQDLYPYAAGGPLTYTEPGQAFFETEQTIGGWFRAPEQLVTTLQELGVPSLDALTGAGGAGDGRRTRWAPIGASLLAVLLLGAGLAVFGRRRGEVAPAAG